MDVEGAEWAVLDAMVREKEPLPFTQLQVRCRRPELGCRLQTQQIKL